MSDIESDLLLLSNNYCYKERNEKGELFFLCSVRNGKHFCHLKLIMSNIEFFQGKIKKCLRKGVEKDELENFDALYL